MSDAPGPAAPAGWYPEGTNGQRYWDGAQWTENRAPLQPSGIVTPAKVRSARTLFIVGLCIWLAASIANGILNAAYSGSFGAVLIFTPVAIVGFVLAVVGLILWLTRRARVSRQP